MPTMARRTPPPRKRRKRKRRQRARRLQRLRKWLLVPAIVVPALLVAAVLAAIGDQGGDAEDEAVDAVHDPRAPTTPTPTTPATPDPGTWMTLLSDPAAPFAPWEHDDRFRVAVLWPSDDAEDLDGVVEAVEDGVAAQDLGVEAEVEVVLSDFDDPFDVESLPTDVDLAITSDSPARLEGYADSGRPVCATRRSGFRGPAILTFQMRDFVKAATALAALELTGDVLVLGEWDQDRVAPVLPSDVEVTVIDELDNWRQATTSLDEELVLSAVVVMDGWQDTVRELRDVADVPPDVPTLFLQSQVPDGFPAPWYRVVEAWAPRNGSLAATAAYHCAAMGAIAHSQSLDDEPPTGAEWVAAVRNSAPEVLDLHGSLVYPVSYEFDQDGYALSGRVNTVSDTGAKVSRPDFGRFIDTYDPEATFDVTVLIDPGSDGFYEDQADRFVDQLGEDIRVTRVKVPEDPNDVYDTLAEDIDAAFLAVQEGTSPLRFQLDLAGIPHCHPSATLTPTTYQFDITVNRPDATNAAHAVRWSGVDGPVVLVANTASVDYHRQTLDDHFPDVADQITVLDSDDLSPLEDLDITPELVLIESAFDPVAVESALDAAGMGQAPQMLLRGYQSGSRATRLFYDFPSTSQRGAVACGKIIQAHAADGVPPGRTLSGALSQTVDPTAEDNFADLIEDANAILWPNDSGLSERYAQDGTPIGGLYTVWERGPDPDDPGAGHVMIGEYDAG